MVKIELENFVYNDLVRTIKYAKVQKKKEFEKNHIPASKKEYENSIQTLDMLLYNIGYREKKFKII